jgi:hypothetical protein
VHKIVSTTKHKNQFLCFVVVNVLSVNKYYAFVITVIIYTMPVSRKGDNSRTHTNLMGFWTQPSKLVSNIIIKGLLLL